MTLMVIIRKDSVEEEFVGVWIVMEIKYVIQVIFLVKGISRFSALDWTFGFSPIFILSVNVKIKSLT